MLKNFGLRVSDVRTQRPRSSSFVGLPYRILNINHKKELLRGLWVGFRDLNHVASGRGSSAREVNSMARTARSLQLEALMPTINL